MVQQYILDPVLYQQPGQHHSLLRDFGRHTKEPDVGALILKYTILGVPNYNHCINIPQNPILIIKAPTLP